jgi:hypothetical protein
MSPHTHNHPIKTTLALTLALGAITPTAASARYELNPPPRRSPVPAKSPHNAPSATCRLHTDAFSPLRVKLPQRLALDIGAFRGEAAASPSSWSRVLLRAICSSLKQ